nr:MAG TPA: hypothetical protein [Caudoviricetes sp.]
MLNSLFPEIQRKEHRWYQKSDASVPEKTQTAILAIVGVILAKWKASSLFCARFAIGLQSEIQIFRGRHGFPYQSLKTE